MNKSLLVSVLALTCGLAANAQSWISIPQEAKPYTRWWWLGSAVDSEGLKYNLEEYAKAGIGGVEITPIYGVKGNDANNISYLSPRWMKMLGETESIGNGLGIETNMATGTGWPFGGPNVPVSEAACKAIFQEYDIDGGDIDLDIACKDSKQKFPPILSRIMAYKGSEVMDLTQYASNGRVNIAIPSGKWHVVVLYVGRTLQMVKRAAPGGEGWVVDHFDKGAIAHYLKTFDSAFTDSVSGGKVKYPHTFFNDSYEVYGADWTPKLLEEFEARRGYALEDYFMDFLLPDDKRTDASKRIISDYRQTIGELLLENFTTQWTSWAHGHGSITRNQAHGSPANLIDVYAAVDIPECEGFGLSNFGIKGLRTDEGYTKKNFSDISMLKYASSGAHISGKKYTSSETFTWLTEHFRTSLSQCKPDLDLMFLSGVNHVFFHGTCYSPKNAEWPGWRFYASVDMSPNNNWWSAMPSFSKYIERCQSFLQLGEPDNDVLVYLPYYDMIYDQPDRLALFDIHSMEKRAPKFINTVQSIINDGYDVDYVSDQFIQKSSVQKGKISLGSQSSALYSAIVVPDVQFMPYETLKSIVELAENGATVMFVKSVPREVPGFNNSKEQGQMNALVSILGKNTIFNDTTSMVSNYGKGRIVCSHNYSHGLKWTSAKREDMRRVQGLSCIRRTTVDGYHYFISNLQGKDVDSWISLGVPAKGAVLYNPMNGNITAARIRHDDGGVAQVQLQLKSGESVILKTTLEGADIDGIPMHKYIDEHTNKAVVLNQGWTLTFKNAAPEPINGSFSMKSPKSWTTLGDERLKSTMATGVYSTTFTVDPSLVGDGKSLLLDLGDVRETAHVYINGKDCGTLFAVPYIIDVTGYVKAGDNKLEVEVANLPANRIAALDKAGVEWRRFKEINVVDLNYKNFKYDTWTPVPSGLCSEVKLIPCSNR